MPTYSEQVSTFLDQLTPNTPELVMLEKMSPYFWLIAIEGYDSAISLSVDDETGIITLASELGQPREETRFQTYETLLCYNGLAELHGGIRMGLREPAGAITQEFSFPIQTLELEKLQSILRDFAQKASAWESLIESAEPLTPEESLATFPQDFLKA
jgi:hypothetical protein